MNCRVLVVDDNVSVLGLICDLLSQAQYQVRPAMNGEQALVTTASFDPNLILLDMVMPILDGNGFLAKIDPVIRPGIIAVTGYAGEISKESKFRIDAVVTKPFGNKQLLDVVEEVLKQKGNAECQKS